MADGEDLLPRVDVYGLSARIRRELACLIGDAVRDALDECGRLPQLPSGAVKATQAAAYIGLSRSKFYEILKKDPSLIHQSFTVGKCRLWPISALDSWIHAKGKQNVESPKIAVDCNSPVEPTGQGHPMSDRSLDPGPNISRKGREARP